MRPIAGTINIAKWIKMSRKKFARNRDAFEAEVLKFLKNPKEISELMMVLDEHLKIMCDMCYTGSIR